MAARSSSRRGAMAMVWMAALLAAPAWAQTSTTSGAPVDRQLNSAPDVQMSAPLQVARGVSVFPDHHVNYVPNVGIIEGTDAVLVVDAGLGPRNGAKVLAAARAIAKGRKLIVTSTHFHPEHAFGTQAFKGQAWFILNAAQADELAQKGPAYIELFRSFGPEVARALEGTELVAPDARYAGKQKVLDLGGRSVELRAMPAHTRGDQIVYLPDAGVVFCGDLVEEGFFPIFPDADSNGRQWIQVLRAIEALQPHVVVPGHGLVGGVERVVVVRDYLETVERRVEELVRRNLSQKEITARLAPQFKAAHASWRNDVFIPYEIAIFYAQAVGKPPELPHLESDLSTPK
jgi:glyoxylase-like metal-dependent hydrolase (beta-lactamase superfamily II)